MREIRKNRRTRGVLLQCNEYCSWCCSRSGCPACARTEVSQHPASTYLHIKTRYDAFLRHVLNIKQWVKKWICSPREGLFHECALLLNDLWIHPLVYYWSEFCKVADQNFSSLSLNEEFWLFVFRLKAECQICRRSLLWKTIIYWSCGTKCRITYDAICAFLECNINFFFIWCHYQSLRVFIWKVLSVLSVKISIKHVFIMQNNDRKDFLVVS